MRPARFCSVLIPLATLIAACGEDNADTAEDTSAEEQPVVEAAPPAPAQTAPPAAQPSSAPLTVADIDRWQRGMEAELKAVREVPAKLASAKTGMDTANLIFGATDMSTRAAGASAAGVDEERYQFIRTTLGSAVAYLAPDQTGMQLTPEMQEELKRGNQAGLARMSTELPPDVVEALRPRAAQLRDQELTLTGERLKAAGAGG